MSPTETPILGLNGLALAWESVAVVLGALVLGLLIGLAVRARTARRPAAARSPERERELESLRRIAAELARTSDVEGVARALLDEIGVLFEVGFAAFGVRLRGCARGVGLPRPREGRGHHVVAGGSCRPHA